VGFYCFLCSVHRKKITLALALYYRTE
jgi:hypothetical protein